MKAAPSLGSQDLWPLGTKGEGVAFKAPPQQGLSKAGACS